MMKLEEEPQQQQQQTAANIFVVHMGFGNFIRAGIKYPNMESHYQIWNCPDSNQ